MADDNEDEPAVVLGEGEPVEGAPLARVSARLMWGIEKSTVEDREGGTVIRTPDGPQELSVILDDVEKTYFDTRQSFESAIRTVIGTGPVPTEDDEDAAEETADESDAGVDENAGGESTDENTDGKSSDDESTDGEDSHE